MDVLKELEVLEQSPYKKDVVKQYLLACCRKQIKYRSSGKLKTGLNLAKSFNQGFLSWKKFHDIEWILEGEAFGVDFYSNDPYFGKYLIDKDILRDLALVRASKQLNSREAKKYLVDLTYFVSSVFSYCSHPQNTLPESQYSQFLCPFLFKRYFGSV